MVDLVTVRVKAINFTSESWIYRNQIRQRSRRITRNLTTR